MQFLTAAGLSLVANDTYSGLQTAVKSDLILILNYKNSIDSEYITSSMNLI